MKTFTLLPGCAAGAPIYVAVYQDTGGAASASNTVPSAHLEMWRTGP